MPSHSDYQPLLQHEDDDDDDDDRTDALPQPVTASHSTRRRNRSGSVDLKTLDVAFKKWTEGIAQKMKALGKKKRENLSVKKEISRSVFEPPVPQGPLPEEVKTLDHNPPMTHDQFLALVSSVRAAILEGHHPKMITKGSSGSYFSRAQVDGKYQTVGVFKPKDEEPYGRLNPKTTKWLHRKMRWIIPFGRACLIPNLSYISEAAASLLDTRLNLNIVPKTELVSLSSPTFFYDWIDRSNARKGKTLPEKIGSMQFFMHGFQDASEFLRRHPLPDRSIADTYDDSNHRNPRLSKRILTALSLICGRAGETEDERYDLDDDEDDHGLYGSETPDRPFHWTPLLLQSLREELEKLVILDYLMRNTDRGSDNYMIRVCDANHERTLVDVAPTKAERPQMPMMSELRGEGKIPSMSSSNYLPRAASANQSYQGRPHVHIAAIDNSLSFPHEHPKGWRNYTYGWLFLPVSLIGRPFSESTRKQILPILTSKEWWEETTFELRKLFELDSGFHPSMFRRQLAVIKGQAWNIVQCLKHSDEGRPLELTRRTKVLVWDDEIEVPETGLANPFSGPITSSPIFRPNELPSLQERQKRRKSRSISLSRDFPPPMRRASTDVSGLARPVSFATKFPRINPGASGVAVLEHLERLDAVEAGLMRLGEDDALPEEEEEGDLGESSRQPGPSKVSNVDTPAAQGQQAPTSPIGDDEDEAADTVGELSLSVGNLDDGETEDGDLGQMTQSLPYLGSPQRVRWASERSVLSERGIQRESLDWLSADGEGGTKMKTVIVERLETVNEQSLFTCW